MTTILTSPANAQEIQNKDLIQWKGSIDLVGEYSSYKPLYQSIPSTYGYLNTNQQISIEGIPFNGNVFLSSYQSSSLNRYSFSFDSDALKANIEEKVKNRIKDLHEIPSIDAMSGKIDKLNETPQYDQLQALDEQRKKGDINRYPPEYESIIAMQDQLARYNPSVYKKYKQYVKLRSMDAELDYSKELKNLQAQGIINSGEALWYNFDAFQVGTTSPYFSDLDLAGIPVKGYYGAFSTAYLYVAATNGTALNFNVQDTLMSFSRDIRAYKLGGGASNKSHLHLSYVHGKDKFDITSVPKAANTIGGFDGRLLLFNNRLDIQAKSYLGIYTVDTEAQAETNVIKPDELSKIKGLGTWLSKDVSINSSTLAGKASHVEMVYRDKDLKIEGEFKRVDPSYNSIGVAYLQSDVQRIQLITEKYVFNRRLRIYGKVRLDEDNLDGTKVRTGKNTNGVLRVYSYFKKLPNISLTYMPNVYRSERTRSKESNANESHMVSIASSKSYRFLGVNQITSGNLTYNVYKTISSELSSLTTSLNQLIAINKNLNTSVQMLYRQTNTTYYWSFSPSFRYRIAQRGTVNISFRYGQDYSQNARYGFDIGSYLKINKKLIFGLSVVQSYYSATSNLTDLRVRTSLRATW